MTIITFLIVGLVAGWIASLLMEGHGLGVLGDLVIGIVGAFIGGWVLSAFGVVAYGFWGSVAMSAVGAIIFLFIVNLFAGGAHGRPLGRL